MKVKILSSVKQILVSDKVSELQVPTKIGIIGILNNHQDLVTSLDIGELVVKEGESSRKIAISGGFLSVKDNNVQILCDDAIMEEEIVLAEIAKAEENAKLKLSGKLPEKELIELEKQLRYEKFKRRLVE
jgi:F-type H+-transporting ATPase subunit epsilon